MLGSITAFGLDSTTLYPVVSIIAGLIDAGGNAQMDQGAAARKSAGALTKIKFTPSAGTITGTISAYSFKDEL